MLPCSYVVARSRFARTVALVGTLLFIAGCGERRYTDEPGSAPVIDRPVALLSAPDFDLTKTELYLVSYNGVTANKIPTFTGPKWQVRWSGDGRRLAISGNTLAASSPTVGTASDIWVLNADGSALRQVTNDGVSDSPNWLPDGRLVYASVQPGAPVQWFAVPAAGGPATPITLRHGQDVYMPDWSRTGSGLTFIDGNATLYAAAQDGTSERALVTGFFPRWSPSGDRIACIARVAGHGRLLIVPASGDAPHTVAADLSGFYGGFTWSPDGLQIAWVRYTATGTTQAVVGNITGSSAPVPVLERGVTEALANDIDVDWRPSPR